MDIQAGANWIREEILSYLLDHFSFERVIAINNNIILITKSLSKMPERWRLESFLKRHKESFRFILHKEIRGFEIKIIYYVNEAINKVDVTDFFPVLMQAKQ